MTQEENIKQELINKFSFLEPNIRLQRQRRIFVETPLDNFMQIFEYAVEGLKFSHLCTITGLDEQDSLSFIYHLAKNTGIVLNIKVSIPKNNPVLKTVTPYFPGADIYERELMDLLGVKVEGLGPGNRYPLPDNWPSGQFPLRKDWKPDEQSQN